ncbi:MAG: phosphohistidine phosphatase SixA [Rhabdochlamydiaceae bacterium]
MSEKLLVCILRHGEAEARPSADDGERHLTEEGSAQIRQVLGFAKQQLGIGIDLIFSSPLARARETARIANRVLGIKDYSVSNSLEPEGEPGDVCEELLRPNPRKRLLLVSHQPLVSRLLSSLLGSPNLAMPTGCIACAEVDVLSQTSTLLFLVPPLVSKGHKERA